MICISERRSQVKFSIIITNQHKHFTIYSDPFLQFVSYMFRPVFGPSSRRPPDEVFYSEYLRYMSFKFQCKFTGDVKLCVLSNNYSSPKIEANFGYRQQTIFIAKYRVFREIRTFVILRKEFLGFQYKENSHEHVTDFRKLRSYGRLELEIKLNNY